MIGCPQDYWEPGLGPCVCEGRVHQERQAWWCEGHQSKRWNDSDICEALAGALQSASPCRMVPMLLVPPGESP